MWEVVYHVKFHPFEEFDCNYTQFALKSEIVIYLDHIIKFTSGSRMNYFWYLPMLCWVVNLPWTVLHCPLAILFGHMLELRSLLPRSVVRGRGR